MQYVQGLLQGSINPRAQQEYSKYDCIWQLLRAGREGGVTSAPKFDPVRAAMVNSLMSIAETTPAHIFAPSVQAGNVCCAFTTGVRPAASSHLGCRLGSGLPGDVCLQRLGEPELNAEIQ